MNRPFKVVLYNTEGFGTGVERQYLDDHDATNIELLRLDGDRDEEFAREAADADGLVIVYTQMTRDFMSNLARCQVIATHSIGTNQVDLKAATELGICIGNVPDYCVEDVAVHTVALLLDAARKISALDRSIRAGRWDVYAAGLQYRLQGRTFGLISFGNIPRRVAGLVTTFGMNVVAYDPHVSAEVFEQYGVTEADSVEDVFAVSDYASVHVPLTQTTRHMIAGEQLDAAKHGMVLIAVGRGGVIDEDDLRAALDSGRISAAGVDVIEDEEGNQSVLMGRENVTMTPHSAYYSEDSLVEVRQKAIMQVNQVLNEKRLPTYLVNSDVTDVARFLQWSAQDADRNFPASTEEEP